MAHSDSEFNLSSEHFSIIDDILEFDPNFRFLGNQSLEIN